MLRLVLLRLLLGLCCRKLGAQLVLPCLDGLYPACQGATNGREDANLQLACRAAACGACPLVPYCPEIASDANRKPKAARTSASLAAVLNPASIPITRDPLQQCQEAALYRHKCNKHMYRIALRRQSWRKWCDEARAGWSSYFQARVLKWHW